MRTRPDADSRGQGRAGAAGGAGGMDKTLGIRMMKGHFRKRSTFRARAIVAVLFFLPALPRSPALIASQVSFEQMIGDLKSPDRGARLRATKLLKESAYPEAALPLAAVVTDEDDEIQREAIAAELNIFLADKVILKQRVGLVIEKRGNLDPDALFAAGPIVTSGQTVPDEVLTALSTAVRDKNPQVMLDALSVLGTLAVDARGGGANEVVRGVAPTLAAMLGMSEPAFRFASLQAVARLFDSRMRRGAPIDTMLGDAVVSAVNDREEPVRRAAYGALGAMRYDRAVQALIDVVPRLERNALVDVALDAAARVAHPAMAELFTSHVTSTRRLSRRASIEGLARLGASVAPLDEIQKILAAERDASILLAGHFAAALLVPREGTAPIISQLVTALGDPRLRDQARAYLFEVAPGRAAAFAPHLQGGDPRLREPLVDALGLSQDPAALPLVEPLTNDADPGVQRAAIRAVSRLRRG